MSLQISMLNPEKTVLLVVDMQNDFVAKGAPLETEMGQKMLPKLKEVLDFTRKAGIEVIYTRHVHREDLSDVGLFGEIYPPILDRACLIDGHEGSEIYEEVTPKRDEIIIKKHRYSAFYGTNLDIILRTKGIENIVIAGLTTEDCCFAAARDGMYRGYKVAVLSDVTGTYDYKDIGFGMVPAEEVHKVFLTILGGSTAHVMTSDEYMQKVKTSETAR